MYPLNSHVSSCCCIHFSETLQAQFLCKAGSQDCVNHVMSEYAGNSLIPYSVPICSSVCVDNDTLKHKNGKAWEVGPDRKQFKHWASGLS